MVVWSAPFNLKVMIGIGRTSSPPKTLDNSTFSPKMSELKGTKDDLISDAEAVTCFRWAVVNLSDNCNWY